MDKPYPPSASRRRALLAQGLAVREPTVVRFFAVAATLLWVAERGSGRLRSWQTWFLEACAGSASVETLAVACARDLAGTLAELAGRAPWVRCAPWRCSRRVPGHRRGGGAGSGGDRQVP